MIKARADEIFSVTRFLQLVARKKPSESERRVSRTRLAFNQLLIGRVQLMGNGAVERVHPGLPGV